MVSTCCVRILLIFWQFSRIQKINFLFVWVKVDPRFRICTHWLLVPTLFLLRSIVPGPGGRQPVRLAIEPWYFLFYFLSLDRPGYALTYCLVWNTEEGPWIDEVGNLSIIDLHPVMQLPCEILAGEDKICRSAQSSPIQPSKIN